MDITHIIAIFGVVITNLTTVIILYCHTDNKLDKAIAASATRTDKLYEMFIELVKGK